MKKQYSQNDEERVILEYLGDSKGTFLSIGENDGVTFSNVRALAERGWYGVCVEPSPRAFKKLSTLYRNNDLVDTFRLAIASHDGKVILKESDGILGPKDIALVSTIIPEETKRFERITGYTNVEVECATWGTFAGSLPVKAYDVISIDAEGMDLEILKQMQYVRTLDFASLVCVEWNGLYDLKHEYHQILCIEQGMHLIYTSAENLIYAR